jgi:DNA topoisomerase-1
MTSYLDGNLILEIKSAVETELRDDIEGLKPEEVAVLACCTAWLARDDSTNRLDVKAA